MLKGSLCRFSAADTFLIWDPPLVDQRAHEAVADEVLVEAVEREAQDRLRPRGRRAHQHEVGVVVRLALVEHHAGQVLEALGVGHELGMEGMFGV